MRNRRLLAYMLLLLLSVGGAASSREDRAAAEKAVRMKTTRQLKEILTELEIKFPKDADKEDLKELALKHDAIARWEELHPEKKKMPAWACWPRDMRPSVAWLICSSSKWIPATTTGFQRRSGCKA